MKGTLKMGLTLALFCCIAAASLQIVYGITKPVIEENARIAAIKKRQEVLPEAVSFIEREIHPPEHQKILTKKIWTGKNKDEKIIGYVIETAPRGYGGRIKTTMGIRPDGKISSIAINKLDQKETPGLGVKVTSSHFKDQFKGKRGKKLKLRKDGGEIDAITSATISSRAVTNGVKTGWDWYMSNIHE